MISGFTIREAEPCDENAIKEICRISFDRLYGYFAIGSMHSSNRVLVGDVGGRVVGFATLRLVDIQKKTAGNILWLAVHPKMRQNGIASGLIDASLDYLGNRRIGIVYVSARKNNSPALYLFERKGFRPIDFRGLIKLYGYRIIEAYLKMRIAPGEIVLVATVRMSDEGRLFL